MSVHRIEDPAATGRGPTRRTDLTGDGASLTDRRAKARVSLTEPGGLFGRALRWYSRRAYGDVPDVALAMAHNRKALIASFALENRVDKLDRLDPDLKNLAVVASAAQIGCSWCLDFGYYVAHSKGERLDILREVPRWRDSELLTDLHKQVIEYAEAMTATPPAVTDEMSEALRSVLGEDGLVELTLMVAVENERSRFNAAMGLTSQGFSDSCELAP